MNINPERLKKRILDINEASRDEQGGYTRLAFSEEDRIAREKVKAMMLEAGLSVHQDAAGNILGSLLNGREPKDFVATGSHIDTVRNAGPLDGLMGVIAAIEVLESIAEKNIRTQRPLQAIVFSDEEGARFGSGMLGSNSIAGIPMDAPIKSFIDEDKISLPEALMQFEIQPFDLHKAAVPRGTYRAFVELHIEQGIVLEHNKKKIGIVNGIKGPYWAKGSFRGHANHAGGTPMSLRHDALVAAAHFATQTNRIANELGADGDIFAATIGVFNVVSGSINTVPGSVEFTVDIRDIDMARRSEGVERIKKAAEEAARLYEVSYELRCIKETSSVQMNTHIMDVIAEVCDQQNTEYMALTSGAFHDTLAMASICQVGMIFVPSIAGISHCPQENTSWEDIYIGADVLYQTILKLANEDRP